MQSKGEDAEGQAYDYTRANELKPSPWFYVTSNVCETHIYDTSKREELVVIKEAELDERLQQIEVLLGKNRISSPTKQKIQEAQTIFKKEVTDEKDFQRLLFGCQDIMRDAQESKTGKDAFDEMNRLLFIKIFEDRRERKGEENRFTSYKILKEGENYVKGALFKDIKDDFKKRGTEIFTDEDKITLDTHTVNLIVKQLEGLWFVDEWGRVYPPVGNVYENFVGKIFRGENGQYFTPRPVVDFIVQMTDVEWGTKGMKVCDPACGSGGFLLSAFSKMDEDLKAAFMKPDGVTFKSKRAEENYHECKETLCNHLLVGYDNESSVAKTTMMNMSVHGDGSTGIYFGNSLIKKKTKHVLKPNGFDVILANPPFSVNVKVGSYQDIDGNDALEAYDLAHTHSYNPTTGEFEMTDGAKGLRGQDSKILFLERCHELVKEGGKVGIVIDDGVLNNPSMAHVRDWIYRKFVLKAVVALPFEIFRERGATNRTSVLILEKKTTDTVQGDVFMAIPEHAGESYGKVGVRQPDQLKEVLKDWQAYKDGKTRGFKISFIVKAKDLENYYHEEEKQYRNRIDPKYYDPAVQQIMKKIEESGCARYIHEIVDFPDEKCKEEEVNAFGTKYISKISKDGTIEAGEFDGVNDPKSKMDRVFKKGDLVASRINIKSGMIALVPQDIEEIRGTGEYYKVEPKKDEKEKPTIWKDYLLIVLTSRPIQKIMNAIATGQYMRLHEDELGKIRIPVPDPIKVQRKIVTEHKKEQEKALTLKAQAEGMVENLDGHVEDMMLNGQAHF